MTRGRGSRVRDIDEVRAGFAQWRKTRQRKARIPDELWSAAVEVARRDGVNRTAAALHLDGGKLKRQMVAADAVSRKAKPPAFVELMASGSPGVPECTLELEGCKGRLRIFCKGASATELAELSRALWDVAC
ncbi:MAG: hypothetical protein ABSH47_25340 [Bryobacteraceae bacterium]|jgi:hypothetical protein